MIELSDDRLTFRFPEVHEKAVCTVEFQRTLRIPDDDHDYPLPPGLGSFPLDHIDDYSDSVPTEWLSRGGVLLPMYQAEALWVKFSGNYPCAVKIAAGKINAVTGGGWTNKLSPDGQDYLVVPGQPWIDGFLVAKGVIRQFVAMPLGNGHTAEEQITGEAEFGGLQLVVYPMTAATYKQRIAPMRFAKKYSVVLRQEMGMMPGGRMRQEIFEDHYGYDSWEHRVRSRCFVHLVNSEVYESVAGREPPHRMPTAEDYTRAGLPWFEYYDERQSALPGSQTLSGLASIGDVIPNSDATIEPTVKKLGPDNAHKGEF